MKKDERFNGFFEGKKVLITGHTGFKGSWMSILLKKFGAELYGYALEPPTSPSMFEKAKIYKIIESTTADIRNYNYLEEAIEKINPSIVIHMASQTIVRESYKNPIETYETNVLGTLNLFQAARKNKNIKVILNVTSDKCYENKEWCWGYRENDKMGGFDPYSSSKGCAELLTASFRNSFFNEKYYGEHGVALASVRAGNVIGGGDFAKDRLIPDFFRSIINREKVVIRNPHAIRPWQHVLEPLFGYLSLITYLYNYGPQYASGWNFGPNDDDIKNVEWIINTLCNLWGKGVEYEISDELQPHEAKYLKLDCSKAKKELFWKPKLNIYQALQMIVEWNKVFFNNKNILKITESQIDEFLTLR